MSKLTLRILVVDDNRSSANALAKLLRRAGDEVEALYDGAAAIDRIRNDPPDIVLTDLKMEPVDGMAVLSVARAQVPPIEAIVFTAFGAVDIAVRAMHLGARDFLTKPVTVDQVSSRLEALRDERGGAMPEATTTAPGAFIANSHTSQALLKTLQQAAGVPSFVWLGGELGSGRTFAARTLHRLGDPDALSTLHVVNPRGMTAWPTEGTVLLSNVDALDSDQQLALSSCIDSVPPHVRVIATASDDGRQQVASGQLRPELYYKLAVVVVQVPPLRRRREDIRPLFDEALRHYAVRYNRAHPTLTASTYAELNQHYWPGNIRELRNLAERTVVLGADGFQLQVVPDRPAKGPMLEPGFNLAKHLEDIERTILVEALAQCDGDRNAAGRLLGVERNTLRYKLNKYDLLDK